MIYILSNITIIKYISRLKYMHKSKYIFGAHAKKDIIDNINRIYNSKGNIVQMFISDISNNISNIAKYLKSKNMLCVIHASYTINCSKAWNNYSWWIKQFINEIKVAYTLGAIGIVVHLGKKMNLTQEESLNNMYTSLLFVHKQTIKYSSVKILIETSAGQGTEICYDIDDLAHFYKKISTHRNNEISNRFGLCIDTCHIFTAGYDISNKHNIDSFFTKFNKSIGLEHVKLLHLNDSQNVVGSRLDRHANLGHGYIGKNNLLYIAKLFAKIHVPIILETPIDHQDDDLNWSSSIKI